MPLIPRLHRAALRLAVLWAALAAVPVPRAAAQASPPDSVSVATPRTVLRRALVAPGWGQLTNRQPAKAVAVWAGLAAAGTGVGVSHVQYRRLRHAALYRRCEGEPTASVCTDVSNYADEAARYPGVPAATLRALRDDARRRRDLFVLGTVVVYGLQALDAYVSAHLRQFDDGSDLSVGLAPVDGRAGVVLRLGR